MLKKILILFICIGWCTTLAQSPKTETITIPDASINLLIAKLFLKFGYYLEAKNYTLVTLSIFPRDPKLRNDALEILEQAVQGMKQAQQTQKKKEQLDNEISLKKQKILLDNAKILLSKEEFDKASELIAKIITETKDSELLLEAEKLLEQTHPPWLRQTLKDIYTVIKPLILGTLLFLILFLILKSLRCLGAKCSGSRWRLLEIKDTTGLGIDKLIVDFLSNLKRSRTSEKEMHDRSASTAGLLSLDRGNPMVPFPEICYNLPETQLLNVFESSQIQMGSFNIGVVAKFLKAVHRWFWFKARVHCILGEAFLIEKSIVIMFTLKTAKKGPYLNTITEYKEIGESSHPLEACKDTVESACFRLIFSIQRLKD